MSSAGGPRVVVKTAPAKLNLTLAVGSRRPDGFHDLHSVMAALGLSDRLSVAPGLGQFDSLVVADPAGHPVVNGLGGDNLVLQALKETRRALRESGLFGPFPALAARLEKRIPVGAGLAGGSSDAAAAIDAALEAWSARLGPAERLDLAAGLGSDVPFFLAGAWALVEGRGERVSVLSPPRGASLGVLLVRPAFQIATAEAFAVHDRSDRGGPTGAAWSTSVHFATELARGLRADDVVARAGVLAAANDLIPATLTIRPELGELRRRLSRLLGRPVGQSGSGPTAWVLYPSVAAAEEAAGRLRGAVEAGALDVPNPGMLFIHPTWLGGAGPVSGGSHR